MRTLKLKFLPLLVTVHLGFTPCGDRRLVATNYEKIIKIPGLIGTTLSSPVNENWNITAEDSEKVVELQIDMNIRICRKCKCDRLFIYDGDNYRGEYCGNTSRFISSSSRSFFVVLLSDTKNTHIGSKLTYRQAWKKVVILPKNKLVIIGIVLAAVIVAICPLIVYCKCKSKIKRTSRHVNYQHDHQRTVWMTPVSQVPEQSELPPSYEEVCNNPEAFRIQDMNTYR